MKTKCSHLPYPADDADMPCVQCYAADVTTVRQLQQTKRIARMRPNPLNQAEVQRLVDNLDSALDEMDAA